MMKTHRITIVTAVLLGIATTASAQKPAAYPAKGQSSAQQSKDDSQCLSWARQQTGVDPAAVAATPTPTPAPRGERVRGAVRGAVVGEVVADDAGAGAAVGALAGGRRARANQAAQVQQAEAQKKAAMDKYYQAYGACMQGRGYSVK